MITDLPNVGNTSRGTTYSNNGGLGIDRGDDGVTGDGMPVLLAVPVPGGGWRVNVSIQREPLEEYTIEFFDNMYVDPSGYGEGQYLLGTVTLTTDETGLAEYEYPTIFPAGFDLPTIRATATGNAADGWTSEFSTIDLAPPITVTGRVWWDDDADGIQDTNETNTSYGWVALVDENGVTVAQMPVNADGSFSLTAPAGTYRLYASQASFVTSPQDQGGDDEVDSDVDAYGYSDWFTLDPDETIDLDVGMVYTF